jgi:hypothetical protein
MLEFLPARFQLSVRPVEEILQVHQLAFDFHAEVIHRERFEAHCLWYDRTACENQRQLAAMQHEVQLMNIFWGRRRAS